MIERLNCTQRHCTQRQDATARYVAAVPGDTRLCATIPSGWIRPDETAHRGTQRLYRTEPDTTRPSGNTRPDLTSRSGET